MNPKKLKIRIDSKIKSKVLTESLSCNSAPLHYMRDKKSAVRDYFTMTKDRAMLGLSYDVGCLNLRANRRAESIKKFGSTQCLVPACTGQDSLQHIIYECQGYETKVVKDKGISSEFIDYLFKLNRERIVKYRTSMVNWKS